MTIWHDDRAVGQHLVWGDEALRKLLQMRREGYSASEIARRLGTTRNSVCGKLSRIARYGIAPGSTPRKPRPVIVEMDPESIPAPPEGGSPDPKIATILHLQDVLREHGFERRWA